MTTKNKIKIIFGVVVTLIVIGIVFVFFALRQTKVSSYNPEIDELLNFRKNATSKTVPDGDEDVFADKDRVRILMLGLDTRLGDTVSHCDAIQMIEIDRNDRSVTITAVPRGTYSPLPPGPHAETDYYISNACGVGGLEYGIDRIEKIIGQKADYVAMVGFSQALGLFRYAGLPAGETLQWLRQRQGYAIGEPQRARNHSNFLKTMAVDYLPAFDQRFGEGILRLMYSLVDTDLSYEQTKQVIDTLISFELTDRPEAVRLLMRPAYHVQDIQYDPETADEYVRNLIEPISGWIPEGAYKGETDEEAQRRLRETISEGLGSEEFVSWAFENYAWLQLENAVEREEAHFDITKAYVELDHEDEELAANVIADYIIEKENLGLEEYAIRGRALLEEYVVSEEE